MLLKTRDLREKNIEELSEELANLRTEAFKVRMQLTARQIENTSELRNIRKSIARVETLIREKQLIGDEQLEDN